LPELVRGFFGERPEEDLIGGNLVEDDQIQRAPEEHALFFS
jgi:hypothetical protein